MASSSKAVTIDDLRRLALRRLPKFVSQPLETGSGRGEGPARNVAGFADLRFLPRTLSGHHTPNLSTPLFGKQYDQPFGITPIGYADYYRRNADLELAQAAREANIPFVLSGGSIACLEAIRKIAPQQTWFQLYGARDPAITRDIVRRAQNAGIEVLVLTVDIPVSPKNDWLTRRGIKLPAHVPARQLPFVAWQLLSHPRWTRDLIAAGGFPTMESWRQYAGARANATQIYTYYRSQVPCPLSWRDVESLRNLWGGKLIVKGVLRGEDAVRALDLGADAVTVSNHGGNLLDCLPSSLEMLPTVRDAVGDRIPVFFDGGIRRGVDILAAYCLGASFCFIGRAALYGAIVGGRSGIARAIQILSGELAQTLAMLGVADMTDASPDLIHRSSVP